MFKITFIGDFVYNYGSAQTLLQYFKISKRHNISISVSGYVDRVISSKIPVIGRVTRQNTDLAVFVFENIMYLNPNKYPERLERYLKNTKRENRIVIDTDGKYGSFNPKNIPLSDDEKIWDYTIDQLTDIVLQPYVKTTNKKTAPFLFFGFPEIDNELIDKKYDIVYVGNNWFREREMIDFLQAAGKSQLIKGVKIRGKGWNRHKLYSRLSGSKKTGKFPVEIRVGRSVLPERLLRTMSTGVINPVLVNDILLQRKLVTPRMFETFAADTIPLFFNDFDYSQEIYSEVGKNFSASIAEMKDKIGDVFKNRQRYIKYRDSVRNHLASNHSYEGRIIELEKIASVA